MSPRKNESQGFNALALRPLTKAQNTKKGNTVAINQPKAETVVSILGVFVYQPFLLPLEEREAPPEDEELFLGLAVLVTVL